MSIAHGIGHHVLHPGNQIYLRAETLLRVASKREAEDFAWGLLVDEREAEAARATEPWEFADYFGIPEEVGRGRIQLRLW